MNNKLESRFPREISTISYADDTTLTAGCEEELKGLLIREKEESEKAGLKLSIQKTKIMASSPIISWQIQGEKVKGVTAFIFLESKITAWCGDHSHEIKRHCSLEEEVQPREHIKKQNYQFADKGPYRESYGFSSSHVRI